MDTMLGFSDALFYKQVLPTLHSMAAHINYMDWRLRLWDYNHAEYVPERVLTFDGCARPAPELSSTQILQNLIQNQ